MTNDGRRFFGLLSAVLLFATGAGCGSASMDGDFVPTDDRIVDEPGRLELTVHGLPTGTVADVTVTSPDGKERSLSEGGTLERLQPGDYTVAAAAVLGSDGFGYRPDPMSQTIVVEAGATVGASVGYVVSSGSLFVAASGLSPAAQANLRVTGPGGFRVDLSEQRTMLTDLEPGSYTVAVLDVASDDAEFAAQAPFSQSVLVNEGFTETIGMSYLCARVFIGDPIVEAELRQVTDRTEGDFDCADLAGVTSLDVYEGAETLVGVQHLRNLERLRIGYRSDPENGIDDLEPLRHLTTLVELDLSYQNVSDLEPLSGLENLRELELHSNATPLDDLTPLESLGSLIDLDLGRSGLAAETIEPLGALTQLENLDLSSNPLGDVTALANLTNLRTLNIAGCETAELSPLAGMNQMKRLYLSGNPITDLLPLSGMTQLRTLVISGTPITDLTALEGMKELELLYLQNMDINDLSIRSLAGMTKLKTLLLQDTSISDISPLGALTSLEWLDISRTAVSDLSPIAKLENLTRLQAASAALTSLDGVGTLRSLTELDGSGNGIKDLSALAGLENLAGLTLNDNAIEDLRPLKGLDALKGLYLNYNEVSDIRPLSDLRDLRTLSLRNNFVSDLKPLVDGTALESGIVFHVQCNKLDLSPGSESVADIAELEADGVSVLEGVQRPDPSCD